MAYQYGVVKIQLRRDTAANLSTVVLASGEPAYATDTEVLKIGNGSDNFATLSGIAGGGGGGGSTTFLGLGDTPSSFSGAGGYTLRINSGATAVEFVSVDPLVSGNNVSLLNNDSGYITAVADDTSPFLGGELNLDNNDIVIDCKNDSGSDILVGTPVYVSGYYANGKSLIAPADASSSSTMPAIGIVNSTITNGSEGTVGIMGVVKGFNTNSFEVGDTIYTANGGGLTNTRPTGISDLIQNLGRVLRKDASHGRVILLGAGRSNDVPNSANFNTLSITNTSTDDSLLITTTEDSSSAAPVLTFKRNSSSPADGDYLGQLKFKGENDADQEVIYAKVTAKVSDSTDTTEDGLLEFALKKAGSNNIGMRLTSTDLKLLNGTEMDMGSQQIHNVLDPTSAQDAATKNYVDTTYTGGSGITISGTTIHADLVSDPNGIAGASGISNIVYMTQAAYDALGSYDATTLYYIV